MNINNSLIFKYIYQSNEKITSFDAFKKHRARFSEDNYITIYICDSAYYLKLNGRINKLNNKSFKIISNSSAFPSRIVFTNLPKS